ncbi:phosphoribosylaminoimidazolesuccinocarboxamide synthase [Candidatus Peregrinibacteria bacterium]|jgi:phosphoribosylaminoimidazole-succinocarboxamide synthase|nr:phosphoribosylaminoimidazolesuccinocarboxamide synthase [Candidatus Peregrinibacteria bacterium]MBT4148352.1 phosphoribosylaminoimidazolesuccinocarboxamide synthase [Candidatus Peregrinibacteria bacterium]MBT4366681.1 phosphoribosylaminoimidazolesuccinocarboxamide synthase [Candidatus Peregrinibacteria bacterium]MBT4455895.1 phosphoribosylaminoimidazolesuccinocarboxamide synthase [Candidatus Peregrinibacteria bacterium]
MLTDEQIAQQVQLTLKGTNFSNLGERYEGKVRDNYTQPRSEGGKQRIIVVTDRLSAFDKIITTVPFKGQVLNQMAKFWFEQTEDIIGNHVIEFPDPNVVVGRECNALPVEMVMRGYLTGVTSTSVWKHYEKGVRNFCGNQLPDGMKKDQKFAEPILTPSTKAAHGGHDESVSKEAILERGVITEEQFETMAKAAMKLYTRGVEIAAKQGVILVDTKYEFGVTDDGEIVLIDEIHTPDSSRFWFANEYESRFEAGDEQKKIDKEYMRKWLADQGFTGDGDVPEIPDEIKAETARRYIEAYELITGVGFEAEVGDVAQRLETNLQKYMI